MKNLPSWLKYLQEYRNSGGLVVFLVLLFFIFFFLVSLDMSDSDILFLILMEITHQGSELSSVNM